jgi:arylsulfatase A-like enzyme
MGAYEWPLPEALHSDAFVGRRDAEAIAAQAADDAPLFLDIGFPGPHPPYDPPAAWIARYRDRNLPIRAVSQADLDAQPLPFRQLRDKHANGHHDATPHIVAAPRALRERQLAHYLANVSLIDREVGRIVDALSAAGRLDDAIVVFTSDHGDCLGDHGHSQKWTMYEEVVRVPLIVRSPRLAARGEVGALVQAIDLAPTLLELAGCAVPEWFEARSLLPALRGEPFPGREAVYCEQGRDVVFQFSDFVSMLRTPRFKYVGFLGESFGQLFDLADDPHEERDRWSDPALRGIRNDLGDALVDWRMRSAYEARDWADAIR